MLVFCGPKVVLLLDTDGSELRDAELFDVLLNVFGEFPNEFELELPPEDELVGWNCELLPACPEFELD